MSSRIVTVFGATGLQGSSVVQAVLKDGTFAVRGVTRNPNSDAAKRLSESGVEVVSANLLVPETVERAIAGSEAVFLVTNFWDKDNFNAETLKKYNPDATPENAEYLQGKIVIDAAKKADIKFIVWSSLPGSLEISTALHAKDPKNKIYSHIIHFDLKANVDKYLAASGLNHAILFTGWFLEDVWLFGALQKEKTQAVLKTPNFKLADPTASPPTQAFTWVTHTLGQSALALFKNYQSKKEQISGQSFYAVDVAAPYEDLAAALSESLGKEIRSDREGLTGSDEVDEMYEYQARVGMYRDKIIPDPRLIELGVHFTSLKEFAANEGVKAKVSGLLN